MTKVQPVTVEKIERALKFLQRRKEHAELQKNKEWTEEFENAIAIIQGLAVYE